MKRILYISYFFPPINTIATYRALYTVKYLALSGYKVDVLCGIGDEKNLDNDLIEELKNLDNVNIYRIKNFDFIEKIKNIKNSNINNINLEKKIFNSNTSIRKFKKFYRFFLTNFLPSNYKYLPDKYIVWLVKSYFFYKNNLMNNNYDVIISSFGPPSVHILAYLIKKKINVKWIADYRDLWSNEHLNNQIEILKSFNKVVEKYIVQNANSIVTVSKFLKEQLLSLFSYKNIYVIYNGYEEFNIKNKNKEKFVISYTGTIYEEKRDPTNLFKAVYKLKQKNIINKNNFEISYAGKDGNKFLSLACTYKVNDLVRDYGVISHKEAVELQFSSDLLLLLEWNDPKAKGVLTGKFFEYLYAKKPILFIGYKYSEINEILELTNSGVNLNDVDEIENFLLQLLNGKKQFKFSNIENFSRKNQTKKLIEIIEKEINYG